MVFINGRFVVGKGRLITSAVARTLCSANQFNPFLRNMSTVNYMPSDRILKPLHVKEKLLLGPGPSNMADSISKALTQPLLGMECAILNLLEPGETILVLQNGVWGQRAADLSRRLNLDVKTITVPEGGIIEYHHTAPISIVYALREALSIVAREGLENVIKRHQVNAQILYDALGNIGIDLFENRLPCLTTIKVPEGVDWKDLQSKLNEQGIEIAGGLGPTAGKIFRIGTFGLNSNPIAISQLIAALNSYLGNTQQFENQKASL